MKMSSKQKRVSALHMQHYAKVMAQKVVGLITYGGGLNILSWISEAQQQGYHVTMQPYGVELR